MNNLNQYEWDKSSGWLDPRKGIQVSFLSNEIQLNCVEKT